jgi:hypothetical protein
MAESIPSVNRRLLSAALLAAPIAARLACAPGASQPATPSTVLPAPALADPVPAAWRQWGGDRNGTFRDLVRTMLCETAIRTHYPTNQLQMDRTRRTVRDFAPDRLVSAREAAHDDYARDMLDQAIRLGFALSVTHAYRGSDVESWYTTALATAGITLLPDAETDAAFARLDAFNGENNRRQGYLIEGERPYEPTEREKLIALMHEAAERLADDDPVRYPRHDTDLADGAIMTAPQEGEEVAGT